MQAHLLRFACVLAPAALAVPASAQATLTSLGAVNVRASSMSDAGDAIAGTPTNGSTQYWTSLYPNFTGWGNGSGTPSISNGGTWVSANTPDPLNANKETASRLVTSTGVWTVLPSLGASSGASVSTASDISADGQKIVGLVWFNAGTAHAFEWTSAGLVDLGLQVPGFNYSYSSRANSVSADGATVVGWLSSGSRRAVRWNGGLGSFLGSLDTSNPIYGAGECYGVSRDGTFVCGTSAQKAFLWSAATGMRDLGKLAGAASGFAMSVSADGRTVVGWSGANVFDAQAVIWREGMTQVESLQSYLTANGDPNAASWTLRYAYDVSGDGSRITGWGIDPTGALQPYLVTLPPQVAAYCTAGTTTNGCVPAIAGSGLPSASQTSGFTISVTQVEGQQSGLLFYGVGGQVAFPWGGSSSFFCVKSPTERTPVQNSGGTLAACDGTFSTDWLAYIAATPGALGTPFGAGDLVNAQAWFRDPPSPKTTMLSNALEFVLQP